jgi:predicted dehydrogenase
VWIRGTEDPRAPLRDNPGLRVVAVLDIDEAAGRSLAMALDAVVATSLDALLHEHGLQALAVLTPLHGEIVAATLDAGLHVFVEKPLCEDPTVARALAERALGEGLLLEVGTMRRFDPVFVPARAALARIKPLRWIALHDACSVSGLGAGARPAVEPVRQSALPSEISPQVRNALQGVHDLAILRELFRAPLELGHASVSPDGWCLTGELRVGELPCLYAIAEHGLVHPTHAGTALTVHVVGERGTVRLNLPDALDAHGASELQAGERTAARVQADVHSLQWSAFARSIRAGASADGGALEAARDVELLWEMANPGANERGGGAA